MPGMVLPDAPLSIVHQVSVECDSFRTLLPDPPDHKGVRRRTREGGSDRRGRPLQRRVGRRATLWTRRWRRRA
jgi:hypothetical protein